MYFSYINKKNEFFKLLRQKYIKNFSFVYINKMNEKNGR